MCPRVDDDFDRGEGFEIYVNGEPVVAYHGETVAGALLAAGVKHNRLTTGLRSLRGYYCGMGVCWECALLIDNEPDVRACMTLATPGMRVQIPEPGDPGG